MYRFLIHIVILLLIVTACKKQELIYDEQANDQYELPLLLRMNGKDCAFDSQLKILKYSIDATPLMNFEPFLEFQENSQITFENQKLNNKSVNFLGDLELNKSYKLKIENNGETSQFSMIFTNIPIVQIVALDEIINEPKALSKMIVNYPDHNRKSDINWTGIELRGATSLNFDKKSYGIGIYNNRSLSNESSAAFFDLPTNDKWILNGMFIDLSKVRNKVSFELWKSMPGNVEHVSMETRFVEVFVNRKAMGLYGFTEKFTQKKLDLSVGSVFYEGTDNSVFSQFEEFPGSNPTSAVWESWEQLFPETSQTIEWQEFENLGNLIVNGSDNEFKNNIANLIDLNNVIDYYLLVNLCYATDNVGKNWHFLKRGVGTKFQIVPWDLDGSWGRNPVSAPLHFDKIVSNRFYQRLEHLNPENYNLRLKQRWQELRSNVFSENNIANLINANIDELKNYQIIPFENQLWQSTIDLESERNYMLFWTSGRLIFLDNLFQ